MWSAVEVWRSGVNQPLSLGGAGALDVVMTSALTAVLLAELVGELLARASRGRRRDEDRVFENGEFRERGKAK